MSKIGFHEMPTFSLSQRPPETVPTNILSWSERSTSMAVTRPAHACRADVAGFYVFEMVGIEVLGADGERSTKKKEKS